MALIDFIQKLQNKPHHVRSQILWLSLFISMTIIVSLWVISLKYSFSDVGQNTEEEQGISQSLEEIEKEVPSLKEAFKASIGAFFEDDLENELEELESQTEEQFIREEPGKIKPAKLPLSD